VRSYWDEVSELIAAAHVHTIKTYGPDRVVGFSPIPAMSMVSYPAGTRFLSMIGGTILSFYDWYADMPIASPQVFGDQTDVPESGDWWNAAYLIIWGTNLPITRTPDAHFMTEARYRGQKVVVVSPDYSDHTKFADDWLPCAPGTDAALASRPGGRPAHPARTTPSAPTTAAPTSTCSAGMARAARRTCSRNGGRHERDRDLQARVGAAAVPDRRAVRRARRTRRVRRDHLPPAGAGRLRAVPGLAAGHVPRPARPPG
jgi:Molybdopterin oxidoreductase